ncbi:glycosyltransferase [uncultured Winogradskyella sp.]|uniref:glycosyltransferase family 4 protein n=1 Tax=uncultured Winogradskyella sp. TaxID=395353 RepID=UPI0026363552|nr:glycosyltransferase [uncultured Winogradskyella sp.]
MKRVLYFIQLPPPIHGAAMTNELVFNSTCINTDIEKRLIRIKYSQNLSAINKFSLKKVLKYTQFFFKFSYELVFYRPNLVYYSIPPTGKGLYKDLPFVLVLKLLKVKPLYHLHGKGISQNVSKSKFIKNIHRWVYSNAVIVHLSLSLLELEIKKLNLRNSDLHVVNNGIIPIEKDFTKINHSELDLNDDILFLSNLRISKGILFALEILNKLLESNKKVKLNIVGDFRDVSTRNKVMDYIKLNNIENNVIFYGALYGNKKFEVLAKTSFLLYPSFNDAYPLVLLESLQLGIPIVASNQGAIPEIVNDEVGYVFKTGDLSAAINLCEQMLNKTIAEKQHMSRECKYYFETNFTNTIFEKNMKQVINAALNEYIN